ncbi:MAG: sulfotransferase family 2 domain-containing protein [Pseudomonadota bacterium]
MIISVHIRKCAGTSLRSAFAAAFGDAAYFDYGDHIGSSWPSSLARRQQRQVEAQRNIEALSRYSLVHGHFFPEKYDFLPMAKQYVTFLRDPVDRVVSNYNYLKRNPARTHPDALIVHALGFSLTEFAAHPDNRNMQTTALSGRTLESFDVVGVVEAYDESLTQLSRAIGVPLAQRPPANVASAPKYLTNAERAAIENANLDDMRLYDRAMSRFLRKAVA